MLRRSIVVLGLLALFGSSCARTPTAPLASGLHIEATLSAASGSPSRPIDAFAVVTNSSLTPVWYAAGSADPTIDIQDASGQSIIAGNPLRVLSPYHLAQLEFAGRITAKLSFNGVAWTDRGLEYMAPEGDYTVVATFFSTRTASGDQPSRLEVRRTFHWTP